MQELSVYEVDEVGGGLIPLLIVGGAFVAGVGVGFGLVAVGDVMFG